MQLGRVFISSVFGGMMPLRQTAAEAARLVGLEPVLAELHVAQAGSVRDALARELAACDTYVGMFDRRRGTVPPGDLDPRAITEMEFLLARELGLRRLAFLSSVAEEERDPGLKAFLDREVTPYASGVWTRYYATETELRREIAAGLAALRPRVVLALTPGAGGLEAKLFLGGVAPAWSGETVLGPVPVDLLLAGMAETVVEKFRAGSFSRSQLSDKEVRFAGLELGAFALPYALGEALDNVLDLAASAGRLVTLEIRTADSAALALPWELISLPRNRQPVRHGLMEIVRRIPGPGDQVDPAHDPAPALPADHLAVLGFTADPVEDQEIQPHLGPQGGLSDSVLFWEKEQERLLEAFETLLRERRGRLVLPDTGEKEDLRELFLARDRPQVVHISSHGGVVHDGDEAEPALFLEDAAGHRAPLRAGELLSWLRSAPGGPDLSLLVLSACSTAGAIAKGGPHPGARAVAAETAEAAGLAETLVRGGFLRVLGMQSTVSDAGATAFAGKFYERLADGADLAAALQAGRAELAAHGAPHEWAVPTLTTRVPAGPLVAPRGSAPEVEHPFEVARGVLEARGVSHLAEGYVGRRDADRRLRSAFETDRIVAIHGLGGIGKSTLAAHFLERRQAEGWQLLILFAGRELAPTTIFEEVATGLEIVRPAGLPPEDAEAWFRDAIQQALRAGRFILYLDNFEDNQDEEGRLRNQELGEALLDLSALGGRDFRILLTSRLRVDLGPGPVEVRNLDLGELSPSGCRKLRAFERFEGLRSLPEEAWQKVLFHLGGHPKALELLDGYLRGQGDRARQLLNDLGPALGAVDAKLSAERQERGRKLLVDNVLATVPAERRPTFDRLCLLEAPLPTEELETLLAWIPTLAH